MPVKFLNLKPEKQKRIIDAAIKEFAQKGYESASTNEIVKEAGISKGLLFHYFKNKKQLFLFLYNYCIEIFLNEFYKKIDQDEKDFFKKLRQTQFIKMELLKKYENPEMFKFMEVAYLDKSYEVKKELDVINKQLIKSNVGKIFENIDITLFKEGIDIKKAINIVIWTLQSYGDEQLDNLKLESLNPIYYEQAFAELDDYIEMLKKCFYK